MKKSVFAVYFAFFTSGIMCTLVGAILPFMKAEYGMSYVLGGSVLSAHQIGNLFAVLFAGFLPYLIGRKRSTIILGSSLVIGFVLMIFTGNSIALILAFGLAGISKGTMSNISNVVISEETANKTAGLNILHAVFACGALAAPGIVIVATSFGFIGWRGAAWFLVVFQLISLGLIGSSEMSNKPVARSSDSEKLFLKSFPYWLNTAILFFYLCCESATVGWLVTYFTESGRMTMKMAQTSATLLWLMIMCGRILCAAVSKKVNRCLLLICLSLAGTIFFVLMITGTTSFLIILGLLGVGFSMSGIYPTTLGTMNARYTSSTIATGTCIAVATCGAVIMPTIVGLVAEYTGISGGISAIAIAFMCMLVLTIVKFFYTNYLNRKVR